MTTKAKAKDYETEEREATLRMVRDPSEWAAEGRGRELLPLAEVPEPSVGSAHAGECHDDSSRWSMGRTTPTRLGQHLDVTAGGER